MLEVIYEFLRMAVGPGHGETVEHRATVPDGALGDLWRCPCGALWRIGKCCPTCDRHGSHVGCMGVGESWRPARTWQKIIYVRYGRTT